MNIVEDKEMLDKLKEYQRLAWEDRNMEFVDFYISIERRLRELIVVGKAIGSLYHNTSDDNAWNAMYEALSDAGLIRHLEDE